MIDTNKYESELKYRMNKEFCNDISCGDMNKDLAIQYAHEFYGNALELLAEVKRLREKLFEAELWVNNESYTFENNIKELNDYAEVKKNDE